MKKDPLPIKPIFLFSLPRTGSTLVQRILMAHQSISSFSEPHIILPLAYTLKPEGVVSEYMHQNVFRAIEDLVRQLPNKEREYESYIRDFVLNIYAALSSQESKYFLDKTPNYHFIIPEIQKIFPDAKFIFLFRNPVQTLASSIETFGKGRLNRIERFYIGAVNSFDKLTEGFVQLKENSFSVNYEDFVQNPDSNVEAMCKYLNLPFTKELLFAFKNQKLSGRLGDPSGVKAYSSVNSSTTEKWKKSFNSRFRKKILIKFISEFSEKNLEIQGYDKSNIIKEILELPSNGEHRYFVDLRDYVRLKLIERFKLNLFFGKHLRWTRSRYLN